MRSRIIILFIAFCCTSSVFAQDWIVELEKHQSKPIKEVIHKMEAYFDKTGPTRANKYHHWLRWRENAINHQNQDGLSFNFAGKNQQLLQRMEAQIARQSSSSARHFHGGWESVNPNNFQNPVNTTPNMGRINCIAKPPSNPNIIYVGASTGGVWKSTDHGTTWTPLWDGMVQMGVSDIVINYTNENHLLALTGDGNGAFIPSSGVFESYDAGATWRPLWSIPIGNEAYGYKIVQDVFNPNQFFLAFAGLDTTYFSNLLRLDNSNYPATVDTLYTSNVEGSFTDLDYQFGSDTLLFAVSNEGVYSKTDLGHFTELPASAGLPSGTALRGALAVSASYPEFVYYLRATNQSQYQLYVSQNGSPFSQVVDENNPDGRKLVDQVSINLNLIVDLENEEKVFIGSVSHSVSTDGGESWGPDSLLLHPDIHDMLFMHGNYYLCTDGGLSYRAIGDSVFININNGLLTTQFYKMDVSGTQIVGGTQDNGTIFWNEGDAVGIRKIPSDGFDCLYHPTNNNIVFTSTQEWTFRSTTNGETNSAVLPNRWAAPIQFWPGDPNRVVSFDKSFMRVSYDNGITWPDTLDIFSDNGQLISGFSQCTSAPQVAYACNINQILRSENFSNPSTATWTDITSGIDASKTIRNLLVHPDSSDVVFATVAGYNTVQVYKSTNGGDDWDPYHQGLKDLPVYCIYYDHVNGNGYYIGTELGVYYRNTGMSEWIPFSTYLPRVQVMDLNVTNTHVYAGTFGRGIWKSKGYKVCNNNLILTQANDPTGGLASGHQIHKASNTILSDRIIRGNAGSDVLYQAGNYVDLIPGFHARQYNLFVAKAAGCLD